MLQKGPLSFFTMFGVDTKSFEAAKGSVNFTPINRGDVRSSGAGLQSRKF